MRRLSVIARLITACAMLAGLFVLSAAAASATTGFINVYPNSAGSPANEVGQLSVTLGSDMPITSLTVDIVPVGGGTPLLSLPMSDFVVPTGNGDPYYHAWTLINPITTTQLTIGTYGVNDSAASSDATITNVPAGTLNFLNEVSFQGFTSNGTTFDFDNQNVTFKGTATVVSPGGTPVPFASKPLVVTDGSGTAPVTTGSDGSFLVTVPAKSAPFWMEYLGDSATAQASSSAIQISVTQFPVTMKASLKVPHAKAGQADAVNGTLTYSDKGVTKPLAGTTVSLYQYFGAPATATAVTSSSGAFSMPVPTVGSNTWTVQAPAAEYFTSATANLPMTVAQPNFIGSFHATLDPFAVLHVSACVGALGKVVLEYRGATRGAWRVIGQLPESGLSCQVGSRQGYEYSWHFFARLASAYYRMEYVATYQTQGAATKAVHLARLFTKITNFRISPTHVAAGGHFTVSGRLWAQGKRGKWSPYGHRKLIVVFHYQGTWYRYVGEPKTTSAGWFKGRFLVYDTTPVFAQYNGDAIHFASASKRIKVTDTGAIGTGLSLATAARLAAHLPVVLRVAGAG